MSKMHVLAIYKESSLGGVGGEVFAYPAPRTLGDGERATQYHPPCLDLDP